MDCVLVCEAAEAAMLRDAGKRSIIGDGSDKVTTFGALEWRMHEKMDCVLVREAGRQELAGGWFDPALHRQPRRLHPLARRIVLCLCSCVEAGRLVAFELEYMK